VKSLVFYPGHQGPRVIVNCGQSATGKTFESGQVRTLEEAEVQSLCAISGFFRAVDIPDACSLFLPGKATKAGKSAARKAIDELVGAGKVTTADHAEGKVIVLDADSRRRIAAAVAGAVEAKAKAGEEGAES